MRRPPEILSREEVSDLFRVVSVESPTGKRTRAMLAVLYRAGLRCGEALALMPKDVSLAAGTIRVLHGKGDHARTVGIDAGAVAILSAWVDARAGLGLNGRQPLFCTLKGQPIKPQYIRLLLPRLARKAGIEKRVHAHGLRHTHAAELMAEGFSVAVISKQLGHASISTTSVYLDHIAPQEVIDSIRSRQWRP